MQRSVRILETWKQKLKAAMDRWARSGGGGGGGGEREVEGRDVSDFSQRMSLLYRAYWSCGQSTCGFPPFVIYWDVP